MRNKKDDEWLVARHLTDEADGKRTCTVCDLRAEYKIEVGRWGQMSSTVLCLGCMADLAAQMYSLMPGGVPAGGAT